MKPFRFRLEKLLEYRKSYKEQMQIVFSQAVNQLRIEQEICLELESKLAENIIDLNNRQQHSVSIEIFKSFRYYFDKINEDIILQKQRIITANEHKQKCLHRLEEAEINYRVVEKYREKKLLQYQHETIVEEQKILDEIGLQAYRKDK